MDFTVLSVSLTVGKFSVSLIGLTVSTPTLVVAGALCLGYFYTKRCHREEERMKYQ